MASRRILSIDGGGIKGVLPAAFLAAIEDVTGKHIIDYFDLIAGTSTGGIIGLGLGLGLSARTILDFYVQQGPKIFDQAPSTTHSILTSLVLFAKRRTKLMRHLIRSKYDPSNLHSALKVAFGGALLGESKTRLIIPAFDRQRREVHVFKTAHNSRFAVDWKQRAVDVALATAAAPTYLPCHSLGNGISLLDGGVWANNPVGLAAVEAVGVLEWPRDRLFFLSLGCSSEAFVIPENSGLVNLRTLINLLMLGQARGAVGTAKLLARHSEAEKRFFRYDQVVPEGTFGLDTVHQIGALRGIGEALAREALPDIASVFMQEPREEFVPVCGRDTSPTK